MSKIILIKNIHITENKNCITEKKYIHKIMYCGGSATVCFKINSQYNVSNYKDI